MKLEEIVEPGKLMSRIIHSESPKKDKTRMMKKALTRQAKRNNPSRLDTTGQKMPKGGGMFSGMF